uniref:Uncharacterized protein n=1 Tax=Arundo donax TaxID=35708 RepID=A0A0A9DXZ4_ARUDO
MKKLHHLCPTQESSVTHALETYGLALLVRMVLNVRGVGITPGTLGLSMITLLCAHGVTAPLICSHNLLPLLSVEDEKLRSP